MFWYVVGAIQIFYRSLQKQIMPQQFTYLLIDFSCVIIPFLASFHAKTKFITQWKYYLIPCLLTALFFIIWDMLFTQWGVWSFNPTYLTGLYFYRLPVEEILFFFCIPYASTFTYYCLNTYFIFSTPRWFLYFFWIFAIILFVTGFLNLFKIYTSVTFILLSLLLALLLIKKSKFLFPFFITYSLILFPFFISNGILTGSLIEKPVVVYNNVYTLGIRLITIPIEDVFYGILLLLLNVSLYEFAKSLFKSRS